MEKLRQALSPPALILAFCLVAVFLIYSLYSQTSLQVGYAVITAEPDGAMPVASALFSVYNEAGVLVSEAGVGASEPRSSGRIFVDQEGTRTGLAIANPSPNRVSFTLVLRDQFGIELGRKTLSLGAYEHLARFVDEGDLFGDLAEDLTGSLTFRVENGLAAALTLRQSVNSHGEPILATLPVADLFELGISPLSEGQPQLVFPQVGAGEGLSTQIVLINRSEERTSGQLRFFDSNGDPLWVTVDGKVSSELVYELEAEGTFRKTLRSSVGLSLGYAVVSLEEGPVLPSGTAIFQYRDSQNSLISEAGVGATKPTSAARLFVDTVGTQTGIALANPGGESVTAAFALMDRNGFLRESASRSIPANGHLAIFVREIFPILAEGFTGVMEVSFEHGELAPVTLKLTNNSRGEGILTTLPVADLSVPPSARTLILPQIGIGQTLSTRLILINPSSGGIGGSVSFFQSDGLKMAAPVLGEYTDSAVFSIPSAGQRQIRPGDSAVPVQMVVDPFRPKSTEVVVNQGKVISVCPVIVDSQGALRDDFHVAFSSLDTEVARANSTGEIEGLRPGFSTLTISSGNVVTAVTITVVEHSFGSGGYSARDAESDSSGGLYFSSQADNTVLKTPSLQESPGVYAGISQRAGFLDAPRLDSLFDGPAFLALDKAHDTLYVSDSANHVIRLVEAGPSGHVRTLAGSAHEFGSQDGLGGAARFNRPQGIALDDRGSLWVADAGNHTIRRIELATGAVSTVAGLTGDSGYEDGTGTAAKFNTPIGLAVEGETLSEQIYREAHPEQPIPPVSVIVVDSGNGVLRRVSSDGTVVTVGPSNVRRPAGRVTRPQASLGDQVFRFSSPTGIAIDDVGNVYVSETGLDRVEILLNVGGRVPAAQDGTLSHPSGLTISAAGRLVVAGGGTALRRVKYGSPDIFEVVPGEVSNLGGDEITVRGRNFASDSSLIVGQVPMGDFQIVNSQTIKFRAPAIKSGLTTLTVQSRGGLAQYPFLVIPQPVDELEVGQITTVAGGASFAGDGLLATSANLSSPEGVALDSAGNLLIADSGNHRIRRVDQRTGIITTIAGNGSEALADSPFALEAEQVVGQALLKALPFPRSVSVGPSGKLFISHGRPYYTTIQMLEPETGVLSRLVDLSSSLSCAVWEVGDLVADTDGSLLVSAVYWSNGGVDRIARLDPETGEFSYLLGQIPEIRIAGIALDDQQNLFICDVSNSVVRKVDLSTGSSLTVAGGGSPADGLGDGGPAIFAKLHAPVGVAVDSLQNVYIVDSGDHRVRVVDGSSGIITTLAGTGEAGFSGDNRQAGQAFLNRPSGICADAAGNVFIADTGNHRIRKVEARTRIIRTVAGSSLPSYLGNGRPAIAAGLNRPDGLAFDGLGNLLISDTGNHLIRAVDPSTGVISTVAGNGREEFSGDGGPGVEAGLSSPAGIWVDQTEALFIADSGNHRIRKLDLNSGTITTVAGNGVRAFSGDEGIATDASLDTPLDVTVDRTGDLYIADYGNGRIRRVDGFTGAITTVADWVREPTGVVLSDDHTLLIADSHTHLLRALDLLSGTSETIAGDGRTYILDSGGPAQEVTIDPSRIAVSVAGDVYFSESGIDRIRKLDHEQGIVLTAAGTGLQNSLELILWGYGPSERFAGDGDFAARSGLDGPQGLAFDRDGNLYLADSLNNRVRAIRLAGSSSQERFRVDPPLVGMDLGATQQFQAFLPDGSAASVFWSVEGSGEIDNNGILTAPGRSGEYAITATSRSDPAIMARATAVVSSEIRVTGISPAVAIMSPGRTQKFHVGGTGDPSGRVRWSATAGEIDDDGLYRAPDQVSRTDFIVTVTATSISDPGRKATALVDVYGGGPQILLPPTSCAPKYP